jgi:hypothetical protein
MYKHLLQYGYMSHYVMHINVRQQRLNGNEYDGVRDLLDYLIHGDMLDSPPPWEEAPKLEELEPTAKAFYDMLAAAKKPLYEGASISQLDAIFQCLANKTQYSTTRNSFEASLRTAGNMLPKGHCLPQSLHKTRTLMKELNMGYQKIECCPKDCLLFWKQFVEDNYLLFVRPPGIKR